MENRCPIVGSEQHHTPDVVKVGKPLDSEIVHVTVYVRRPESLRDLLSPERLGFVGRAQARHLLRTEFKERYAADPEDLNKVVAFAREHGLHVHGVDADKCVVKLSGTVPDMNKAFDIELLLFEKSGVRFRSHVGAIHIPEGLKDIIKLVVGVDNHPIVRRRGIVKPADASDPGPGSIAEYTAPEVARLYRFPDGFDGEGRCLGIIELSAGFFESDLDTYFSELAMPKPEIIAVGPNDPGSSMENPNHGYGEVMMDIEVAGAVVPKAKIVVYFAKGNSQKDFMEVLQEAIHDSAHAPEAISVSWGEPETAWSPCAAEQMRQIISEGALLGVTVCVASGDQGASDGLSDGRLVADFPGSVPEALCCGGTRMVAKNGVIEQEIVWNDPQWKLASGGGVSTHFLLPAYQAEADVQPVPAPDDAVGVRPAGLKGRAVPDVSGNADPMTGYRFYILGNWHVSGGTSAVAPLWAALIIRLNQALGRCVGFVNPFLYKRPTYSAFRDITEGNNGYYEARPGWDACTGLGSPNGTALLKAMSGT